MYLNQSVSPLYTLKTKKDAEKILGIEVKPEEEPAKPAAAEEVKPAAAEEVKPAAAEEEGKEN